MFSPNVIQKGPCYLSPKKGCHMSPQKVMSFVTVKRSCHMSPPKGHVICHWKMVMSYVTPKRPCYMSSQNVMWYVTQKGSSYLMQKGRCHLPWTMCPAINHSKKAQTTVTVVQKSLTIFHVKRTQSYKNDVVLSYWTKPIICYT